MISIVKCIFLFVAVWLTVVNIVRAYYKQRMPAGNILFQAVGITGFYYFAV